MSTMRSKTSVAAVYDRRMEDDLALIETPLQDKPVRCSGGLRPPEENETVAHRDAATEQQLQKARLRRLDRVFVDLPIYFLTACIEALVAFANAQGGSVLVGVSDAGHSLGVMIFALSCL